MAMTPGYCTHPCERPEALLHYNAALLLLKGTQMTRSILIAALLAVGLTACKKEEKTVTTPPPAPSAPMATPAPTPTPAPGADTTTTPGSTGSSSSSGMGSGASSSGMSGSTSGSGSMSPTTPSTPSQVNEGKPDDTKK